jgi:hypothetical protein
MEKTIEMKHKLDKLQDLYYENGKKIFFKEAANRKTFFFLMIAILFFLLSTFLSPQFPAMSWIIFVSVLVFCVSIIILVTNGYLYIKWKKPVDKYIHSLVSFKSCKVNISEEAFELINDDVSFIEKWNNIKASKITNHYCHMTTEENIPYIFFASSMTADEFEFICDVARRKAFN